MCSAPVSIFKMEDVSWDIAKDIEKRLHSIYYEPSLLCKMIGYLKWKNLPPENTSKDKENFIKRLNSIRNSIVHHGTIRIEKLLGMEVRGRLAGASTFLIQNIVEPSIAKIFGLNVSSYIGEHMNVIKKFFSTGNFGGQNVVEETYGEALDRLGKEWVENGRVPS